MYVYNSTYLTIYLSNYGFSLSIHLCIHMHIQCIYIRFVSTDLSLPTYKWRHTSTYLYATILVPMKLFVCPSHLFGLFPHFMRLIAPLRWQSAKTRSHWLDCNCRHVLVLFPRFYFHLAQLTFTAIPTYFPHPC
jgi:hypothetical protein